MASFCLQSVHLCLWDALLSKDVFLQAARLSALKALKANGGTMPAYPGMRRRILSSGRLLDSTGSSTSSPAAGGAAMRKHTYSSLCKHARLHHVHKHCALYTRWLLLR